MGRDGNPRSGARGGAAEFKWTDVAGDKDRENYLGHSISAPVGRWQKNKDIHWYNRDKDEDADARAAEMKRIKQAEEDAMNLALGYKPAVRDDPEEEERKEQERMAKKAEAKALRRIEKEEKRARKEEKRVRKEERRSTHSHRDHRDSEQLRRRSRSRSRSRSPPPRARRESDDWPRPRRRSYSPDSSMTKARDGSRYREDERYHSRRDR